MVKGRELIGLPVITLDKGEQIANIQDVIFDPRNSKVLALVTEEKGWFKGARIIPFKNIYKIGEDAVTVETSDAELNANDLAEIEKFSDEEINVIGTTIITESGNNLGVIEDIIIDIESGYIEGYEISGGVIKDLIDGRVVIPLPDSITIGKDAVIVPDWVENKIKQQGRGLKAAFSELKADTIREIEKANEELDLFSQKLKRYGRDIMNIGDDEKKYVEKDKKGKKEDEGKRNLAKYGQINGEKFKISYLLNTESKKAEKLSRYSGKLDEKKI